MTDRHMTDMTAPSAAGPLATRAAALVALAERIPHDVIALCARIFPAAVFWASGQTKLEGWRVSESAVELFKEEYKLPLLDPTIGAHMAAFAETAFPILLVLGLASRLSALALLGMTLVIQLLVYPGAWPTHGVWATCFLIVIARGPGRMSLDHLIFGAKR
ncbi:MAG: DoxX family protein [Beijerinckiaceae bacterium]|nr:DoxX family protein [Beijerinckiaceae bacterium]